MWMNGSRSRRSTPANARRTGKPSPSKPDGAVVTERTRRRTVPGAGTGTRGRVVVSSTVTAGMPASLVEVSTSGDCSAADPRCHSLPRAFGGVARRGQAPAVQPASGTVPPGRLSEADGVRPVRRGPRRRTLRARRAPVRLPRRAAGAAGPSRPCSRPMPSTLLAGRRRARRPGRPLGRPVRPGLGAPRRRRPRAGVGRAARRRARQPPGLPADDVRRRGHRRRRPALDDADLPRPQPRRARAGAGRAGRGRRRRRPLRDRRRPRGRASGPASPRCSTSTASGWPRSPRRMGLPVAVPESPEAPPVGPAARPRRREAAGRRAALRAQPREQPGAGGAPSSRPPGPPAPRCRSSPGSRSTPTSRRPGCCSASRACTWTARWSNGCWPRRTRVAAGIAAAVDEARALLAMPGVVGVNLSGTGSERRRGRRRAGQGRGGRTTERGRVTGSRARRWRRSSTPSPAWTEEAVRALGPEYAIPAGVPGQRQRGRRCAGWPTGWTSGRRRGCSTPARASAGRPGGWPPSAA